jgi:hypothetical protein
MSALHIVLHYSLTLKLNLYPNRIGDFHANLCSDSSIVGFVGCIPTFWRNKSTTRRLQSTTNQQTTRYLKIPISCYSISIMTFLRTKQKSLLWLCLLFASCGTHKDNSCKVHHHLHQNKNFLTESKQCIVCSWMISCLNSQHKSNIV